MTKTILQVEHEKLDCIAAIIKRHTGIELFPSENRPEFTAKLLVGMTMMEEKIKMRPMNNNTLLYRSEGPNA